MNIGSKSQYQRGLLNLQTLGYEDEHIEQVKGLVDAALADYDSMLRAMVSRVAASNSVISQISLNAAAGGIARNVIEDNDECIYSCLEFLARRTYDRIPFKKFTRWKKKSRDRGWSGPLSL
jgi:3-oxoacyl-ACP reductase-like protein